MPMTLGTFLAHRLAGHGVTHVFGIPGVHNVEMYRGMEQTGITHVLARNEMGAGFMADGFARATGRPGVAFVITGPGLTNIMTPMGQAWSDRVPLLVISSCLDQTAARRGQLHQMRDQRGAAAAVCAWSEEVRSAEAAIALVDRAMAEFALGARRPVHIQVPIAILGGPAPGDVPAPAAPSEPPSSTDLPGALIQAVRAARRPLLVLGGGIAHAAGAKAARAAMARLGAAVFTTYAGRGIIAPDSPLNFGAYLARPGAAEVIASADLVLAIGTELAEVDLWRPHLGHRAPMVRVDTDPQVLADAQAARWPVRMDGVAFLNALMGALGPEHAAATGWRAEEIARHRAAWRAEVDAARPGIAPLVDALRAALPADATLVSDMTQFAYVAKEIWDMPAPGLWHHPFGFGTLGFGLPAAIGARTALPAEQPVVAIVGDSGLQYTLAELGTAAELGLPLPIILWDNGKLKEIEDCMISAQITPKAVQALNPDFALLARAYGMPFHQPGDPNALTAAVAAALAHPGPSLLRLTPSMAR